MPSKTLVSSCWRSFELEVQQPPASSSVVKKTSRRSLASDSEHFVVDVMWSIFDCVTLDVLTHLLLRLSGWLFLSPRITAAQGQVHKNNGSY